MNLQELRETIPEGTADHSVVWTMNSEDKRPQRVSALDTSKPCVFFFGGGAYLSKGEKSVPAQMKSMREMLAPIMPESGYNFYTLTTDTEGSKKVSMDNAGKKNLVYNDYPNMFFSKEAESFVNTYLNPLVEDIKNSESTNRAQLVASTAKNFSALTFLGFSYGTAFIQEISNALNVALDEKGYSPKEKATVMKSLAAINIGATFKYTPKYPDIAQTTLVLASDKDAVRSSGICLSNPEIEFNHPTQKVAYSQNEAHTIIHVCDGSTRLRGLGYRSPTENESLDSLIGQAKNWTDTFKPKEDSAEAFNQVVPPHNKSLQTASLRWEVDPETIYYTFPSNLVGTNTVRFLQSAVKSSAEAIKNDKVRDTIAITNECVTEHLNADAIKADMVQTQFFKNMFDNLSGCNVPAK